MSKPKQKYDKTRMEMYPPILIEPYTLRRGNVAMYVLMKGDLSIMPLRSQSEAPFSR